MVPIRSILSKTLALACLFEIFSEFEVTSEHFRANSKNVWKEYYDFIIVGGGTSGCVLANRLSEKFNVLVLEEGELPPEDFEIPAKLVPLFANSTIVKSYKTLSQQNAGLGTNNGRINYVIGKSLGGSSQINGMVFNRGSPYDYDNWANITGDPNWKYDNLMKFFKRIEDYHGNFSENGDQHGKSGPITISQPKYTPGLRACIGVNFVQYIVYDTKK